MSACNLWNIQVNGMETEWLMLKNLLNLIYFEVGQKKCYYHGEKKNIGWLQPRYFSACNLVAQLWQETIFFCSPSWLVKKVKNVDPLLYASPFLFYNFVSCTCTLEVTLHSVAFFLFRLCFKYNSISKTMPYVYFPHFRIRNIFSLVVISQTFGQQRQSTHWESGVRRDADLKKKKTKKKNMYGWLITWSC